MVNYQEGLIYKIAHKYSPYVYIGSTTNFNRRKATHKHRSNTRKEKLYQTIRELGGWDNFEMVLVKKCPCNDKLELTAIEFEYQQLFDANMNMSSASSGLDFSDSDYMKKYYEKNNVKLSKYNKKYREENCEELKKKSKEYYEKNREKLCKNNRDIGTQYREKNREKIREKGKEKIECECGCVVTYSNIIKHRKSQRHINLMSS
tara:strand:+ start:523 stop:1134 length:612 start_codon:yes stop_codon:yes gene_type:complete